MRVWMALLLLALSGPALAYYPYDMWQGDQAIKEGRPAQAEGFYRRALTQKPDDPTALYNLGISLYRQGQYKGAAEIFNKLVESKDPDFLGRAAYNRGNALFQQEDLEGALEAYKTALRWNELDDDARYNIEVILEKQKQDQKPDQQKKEQDKEKEQQDQKKKDDPKKPDDQKKDPQKQKKDQPQKPQQPKMNRQDAERLLRYFQDKEDKNAPRLRTRKGQPLRGTETW